MLGANTLHPAAVLCLWAGTAFFFPSCAPPAPWWTLLLALLIAGGDGWSRLLRCSSAFVCCASRRWCCPVSLLDAPRVIVALRKILSNLEPLGVSSQRMAARFSLVLEAVGPRHRHWRDWMTEAETPVAAATPPLRQLPLRRCDHTVSAAVAVAGVAWGFA